MPTLELERVSQPQTNIESHSGDIIVAGLDLAFNNAELEADFTQHHNYSQIYYDVSDAKAKI